MRDSYFCGVKYGIFDLAQLHRVLKIVEDPTDKNKQMMISPDGIHALEQFILAKYYLTTQVYRHKVRIITDQMISRAIRLGIEADGIEELRKLYSYNGDIEFVHRYVHWDDSKFLLTFSADNLKGTYCHDLLMRLIERRLFKRVYEKKLSVLPPESRDPLSRISEPDSAPSREKLEQQIFAVLKDRGIQMDAPTKDPFRYVIVHSYATK